MSMYDIREVGRVGDWMMGAVTRNPEGLLFLAAGVALLMRSGRGQSTNPRYTKSMSKDRRDYAGVRDRNKTGEGVGEQLAEAARGAGEYVSEVSDKITETASSYASSAADYADETARAAIDRSKRMADQARETADYVVREQPWAVALTGFLAGAAVAAAFSTTRFERRTLGDVGKHMRSAVADAGEQVVEAGLKAAERLGEVAEERGLTSEGLKEAARNVGETFSSALTGEKEGSGTQRASNIQSAPPEGTQSNRGSRPSGMSSNAKPMRT